MGWSIHHPVGLLHCTPAACQRGYTLFATTRGGRDAYLIDLRGNVVHRWHSEEGIHYAGLLDNGNLLCRTFPILTRVIQWQCQLACRWLSGLVLRSEGILHELAVLRCWYFRAFA